jgi:hypothetical protein
MLTPSTRKLAGHGPSVGDLQGFAANPAGYMAAHAITLVDFDDHLTAPLLGGIVLQQRDLLGAQFSGGRHVVCRDGDRDSRFLAFGQQNFRGGEAHIGGEEAESDFHRQSDANGTRREFHEIERHDRLPCHQGVERPLAVRLFANVATVESIIWKVRALTHRTRWRLLRGLLPWLASMSAHSGGFRGQGKRGPLLQNLVLLRNTPVA